MKIMLKHLFSTILIFTSLAVFGQTKPIWDYPIKPKTEEWKTLKNHKAQVAACQIPEPILQQCNAEDLATLCMNYPLLYNVFYFNDKKEGVKKLFSEFNGIRAFSKRENAFHFLLEKYLLEISSFPEKLGKATNQEIGHSILCISILEFLLSSEEFHNNSSPENLKRILGTLWFGYNEKYNYSEKFAGVGFTSNLLARAHIIILIDPTVSELFQDENEMVLYNGMADANLIDIIDQLTFNLIR